MSETTLQMLLKEIYANVNVIVGDKLNMAVLYGSYARGDFDSESDIDIALIIDADRMEIKKYSDALVKQMSYFMLERDVLVSFSEIPLKEFEEYKDTLPYYANIAKEGVRLSA